MSTYAIDGTVCGEGRLVVATGDITRLRVDAIVNAANSTLMGGGGVDGAIHSGGGSAILEECRTVRRDRYPDGLPTGEAVVTTGGNLPAGHVIHTVGPVWHGGSGGEDELLARAYRSSLELAADRSFQEIAFPAISTGIYGFPRDRAAAIVYRTVTGFLNEHDVPRTVYLVFFAASDARTFLDAVECR